jgi:hypothetical protein
LKNEPKIKLIKPSKFYIALDSIQRSDSLILNYLDAKEAIGNLSSSILASGLLYNLSDNNEYFAKRIFAMDIIEKE